VRTRHDVGHLPHRGSEPAGVLLARDRARARVAQVRVGDCAMRGGSVAEKSAVCRSAGAARGCARVVGEAHVEHLVGLVEHDGLHALEVERARRWSSARPGRGAHDVHAAASARAAG
jgi:hypothetical protein